MRYKLPTVSSLALCAALVAALAAVTSASASVRPASSSLPPTPGSSKNCSAGFDVWVPRQASLDSEGAVALIPPGLSILAANAANIPALHAIMALRPTWLSELDCKSTMLSNQIPGRRTGEPQSVRSACESVSLSCSPNWSGYTDPSPSRGYKYFSSSSMEWKIPAIKGPSNTTHVVSVWPGIETGDSNNDTLIQAGSQSGLFYDFDGIIHLHWTFAWFQLVPGGDEKIIDNLPVHAGTQMLVTVSYEPGRKKSTALFILCAGTKCGEATKTFKGKSGTTAEWIAERPTVKLVHSRYVSLDNFGKLLLSSTDGSESNSEFTRYFGATRENSTKNAMTNCHQTEWLAVPGRLKKSAFTDAWTNYGPSESCSRYPD
jgi:hypothetical protein